MTIFILLVFGILGGVSLASEDIFSSMAEIQKHYEVEQILLNDLEAHVKKLDVQLSAIDWFKTNFYSNHEDLKEKEVEEYISNPINTFAMIRRLADAFPQVLEQLADSKTESQWKDILAIIDKDLQVDLDEVTNAIDSIALLHETFDLNSDDLARGDVSGYETKVSAKGLDVEDMINLAKSSFNRGFYDRSYDLINAAQALVKNDSSEPEMNLEVERILDGIVRNHDQILLRKGPRGDDWRTFMRPIMENRIIKKKFKKYRPFQKYVYNPKKQTDQKLLLSDDKDRYKMWEIVNNLCRRTENNSLANVKSGRNQRCLFYDRPGDAWTRLAPFKLEVLSQDPTIVRFHEFLHDSEMNYLTEEPMKSPSNRTTLSRLERSKHANRSGMKEVASKTRTSKQVWMFDNIKNSPMVKRIESALGVDAKSRTGGGGLLQVANYGLAGAYNQHHDTSSDPDFRMIYRDLPEFLANGPRVATVMAYLSQVEAGGATVFPNLGIGVRPRRGDVLVWFNLNKNGVLDKRTFHGGCPVIKGSKWIANKWIKWYPQFKTLPCTLNRKDDNILSL